MDSFGPPPIACKSLVACKSLGIIRRYPLLQIVMRGDRRVAFAGALDHRVVFVNLSEKRHRIARPKIFVRPRHAHTVQGRQKLIVAPAHQHMADIAGDNAGQRLDVRPGQFP